jgi:thiol-disulfide isomerase/thioredoxin
MRKFLAILALALLAVPGFADLHKAPDFSFDAVWIDNGKDVPHSIMNYRGHVLLIDFWEYTCINCIRDFAVLKRWYAKYHSDGFDVIGVHYGEFAIGFSVANVRQAAKEYGLPWPVIADIHGSIWNAYDSDVWPNRYLIDQNGNIVMHVEGEGNSRPMEEKIRALLAPTHPDIKTIAIDPPDDTFTPQCGIPTQETYVGNWFGRGALEDPQGYSEGDVINFKDAKEPNDGGVVLNGKWETGHDGVTSAGGKKPVEAELRYHARAVYSVLSLDNSKKSVRVYIRQDGKALDHDNAGKDVQLDSNGSYIDVSEPRMYYVVLNPAFAPHLLLLEPQDSGLTLHSFTYGNNCQLNFGQM